MDIPRQVALLRQLGAVQRELFGNIIDDIREVCSDCGIGRSCWNNNFQHMHWVDGKCLNKPPSDPPKY